MGKIKTLIFGADGMLGSELSLVFKDAIKLNHNQIDITDENKVIDILNKYKPDLVINAAAYTDVDGCEDKKEFAFDVNGNAPGYIAKACSNIGARFIHFSTDYVFDGCSKEGYKENDNLNPINIYGKSKLFGEINIIKNMTDYRIIRTSWLFGRFGKNFVKNILNLSKQREIVKIIDNQVGKPTYAKDLAYKTKEIVGLAPGIYHITNWGVCSWYEFASAFIDNAKPCTSDEFIRKANRPKNSVLVNTKTTPMRCWQDALKEYLNTLRDND